MEKFFKIQSIVKQYENSVFDIRYKYERILSFVFVGIIFWVGAYLLSKGSWFSFAFLVFVPIYLRFLMHSKVDNRLFKSLSDLFFGTKLLAFDLAAREKARYELLSEFNPETEKAMQSSKDWAEWALKARSLLV